MKMNVQKKSHLGFNLTHFILILGIALLTSCANPSVRYFLMDPIHRAPLSRRPWTIGVARIQLASYLHRPQIVTRYGVHGMTAHEFDRWGEPLRQHLQNLISHNLAILFPAVREVQYPWPGDTKMDYRLNINVKRFDTNAEGITQLDVYWTLSDAENQHIYFSRHSHYETSAMNLQMQSIVNAMNVLVSSYSTEMAKTMLRLR